MPTREMSVEINRCTEKAGIVFSFRKFAFCSPRIGSKNWSSTGGAMAAVAIYFLLRQQSCKRIIDDESEMHLRDDKL